MGSLFQGTIRAPTGSYVLIGSESSSSIDTTIVELGL